MKWFIFLFPCLCFAQTQLNVSAVVLPQQCDISEPCEPISDVVESATITEDTVKYVGSKPTVTITDGTKTVLF